MHRHEHFTLLAMKTNSGFTLIELLVTVAIGVTLMVVAAPSFVKIRANGQLADAVNSFIVSSGTAKSGALKTGKDVYLVANDTTLGWRSGWFVFVDNNWDEDYDAGTDEVLLRHEALAADIVVTTASTTTVGEGYLRFNGSGFPKTKTGGPGNGTVQMANPNRTSSIVIDTAGRVRSCNTGTVAGCPFL